MYMRGAMYKGLIEDAHKEGIQEIVVAAIIHNEGGQVLLIHDLQDVKPLYIFPEAKLKEEESLSQALQRAVTGKTNMGIKEVNGYLGHYDEGRKRYYHFVVEVNDPYAVEENKSIAYAWLDIQEAVGYPIKDAVREILDLYNKTV